MGICWWLSFQFVGWVLQHVFFLHGQLFFKCAPTNNCNPVEPIGLVGNRQALWVTHALLIGGCQVIVLLIFWWFASDFAGDFLVIFNSDCSSRVFEITSGNHWWQSLPNHLLYRRFPWLRSKVEVTRPAKRKAKKTSLVSGGKMPIFWMLPSLKLR